jgi:hypothetical protein
MTEFNALLAELDSLSKAMPTMDAGELGDNEELDEDGNPIKKPDPKDATGENSGEGEPMGKSLQVTLADGTLVEAIDGTEMVKSLQADIDALTTQNDELSKALTATIGLVKQMHAFGHQQVTLMKSLRDDVAKFGGQPTGRRSVLSVNEKIIAGTPAAAPAKLTHGEIMAKALQAQKDGRIESGDVARIEARANRGIELPADLMKAIGIDA